MKSTLRTTAAAALLLAPLGAVLVAQPAAAQHVYYGPAVVTAQAVVAPRPVIERFVVRGAGSLEPGRELRFRLVGVPGAQAFLEIPGVVRAVQMVETRPGVYETEYVIRRRDNLDAFPRAVASLHLGSQRVTARVELGGDRGHGNNRRDDRPPLISDVTPANGDRVGDRGWTRISARLSDDGSGVDPASVVLRVNGRDVTSRTRIDGDELRFRDDLAPGRHVADLLVRDRAGNATRHSWTFNVVDRDRGHSYYNGGQQRW
jgi:hypothetical protein